MSLTQSEALAIAQQMHDGRYSEFVTALGSLYIVANESNRKRIRETFDQCFLGVAEGSKEQISRACQAEATITLRDPFESIEQRLSKAAHNYRSIYGFPVQEA